MQLKYGGYPFQSNSLVPQMSISAVLNPHNQVYEIFQRVRVQGTLLGDGTAATLTALSNALQAACTVPGKDLVYLDNNGTVTSIVLRNAGSSTGVHLAAPIDWMGTDGAEYVNFRRFTIAFEARYPATGSALMLLSFHETLSFAGGGPVNIHKLNINGAPQKQTPYLQTPYRVLQSGSAVGYRQEPALPPPLWPSALKESPAVDHTSPMPSGLIYTNWPVSWRYEFESAVPLVGVPTRWVL